MREEIAGTKVWHLQFVIEIGEPPSPPLHFAADDIGCCKNVVLPRNRSQRLQVQPPTDESSTTVTLTTYTYK